MTSRWVDFDVWKRLVSDVINADNGLVYDRCYYNYDVYCDYLFFLNFDTLLFKTHQNIVEEHMKILPNNWLIPVTSFHLIFFLINIITDYSRRRIKSRYYFTVSK